MQAPFMLLLLPKPDIHSMDGIDSESDPRMNYTLF